MIRFYWCFYPAVKFYFGKSEIAKLPTRHCGKIVRIVIQLPQPLAASRPFTAGACSSMVRAGRS